MSEESQNIDLNFNSIIKSAKVFSRDEVVDYDPVTKTLAYMRQIVDSERAWDTIIHKTRENLLQENARQLYLDFFTDLKYQIEVNSSKAPRLARLLELVAIRGFGMTKEQVRIEKPLKGGTRWQIKLNSDSIERHLDSHIIGKNFLNPINADNSVWENRFPRIASSDVSQHRSAVPVPAHFFKRQIPFILNNAAGTLLTNQNGDLKYHNLFNPKPDEELLQWMLIDPSYQEELETEDYHRCLASAMDVGQYKFDYKFLLNADKQQPDIIFRDGSLFPQDAYLDNFLIDNRRGEFTREAIKELLNCLNRARDYGIIYCGVSKNVQLKVYSAIVDWYIAKNIDKRWEVGNYTFNDGQSMTLLLSSPDFVANNLQKTVATCLIRRSFTTRANLNTKANINDLKSYFTPYENSEVISIKPFKQLCNIAHIYMFFIGHSKTPELRLPRYEFFYDSSLGEVETVAIKILSALQNCSIDIDEDHAFMNEDPITYIIPTVTREAHNLSKDVGKCITEQTEGLIMSRYKNLLSYLSKEL